MLQQLAGHDDVEACVVEGERLFDVRPDGFDPELGGLVECAAIDVDPHDLVAGEIGACQRSSAAAEVENSLARPADNPLERLAARGPSPDEARLAPAASVVGIKCVQRLQAVDSPV